MSPLLAEHLATAYQLHCQHHLAPWSEKSFSTANHGNYYTSEVIVDRQFAGYCVSMQILDEVTLMDLAVCPKYRGFGGGRMLLDELLKRSQNNQAATIWLEVRSSNIVAINLYQSMGFTTVDVRKNYYPTKNGKEDALVMQYLLVEQQ